MSERGRAFVQVLSCVLSRLVAANDSVAEGGPVTKFHALRPPSISIFDYCARIHKYASCSPECFVLALVYIDRLIQRNSLLLNSLNVHRVIITAVMLAAKFFDDQYFNNAYYGKVGGVPTVEVNSLELEFLFSINFSLHVPTDVYEKYYAELANHMGIGVPAELVPPPTTCECSSHAGSVAYSVEETVHTGMKSLADIAAESLRTFNAQAAAAAAVTTAVPSSEDVPMVTGGGGVDAMEEDAAPQCYRPDDHAAHVCMREGDSDEREQSAAVTHARRGASYASASSDSDRRHADSFRYVHTLEDDAPSSSSGTSGAPWRA